jgi:tRNA-Thr(GGU) m(6)t(6)A37 methyltransferase TsaA
MITFKYIGHFICDRDYKDEQPRQGVFSDAEGYIELIKGENYEQGLKDLEGFEYIWVIFVFHHNSTWKPVTNPPYSDGNGKKGLFATRSPYRPNPIGMSCVKLDKISGNRIYIKASDILNNTPVLDIKPYISDYDSFPDASRGWLDNIVKDNYSIEYSHEAGVKVNFLKHHGVDLTGAISSQLAFNPFDKTRNKFEAEDNGFIFRFKTWMIKFTITDNLITIENIYSGYKDYNTLYGNDTPEVLAVHKLFNENFI